MQRPRNRQPRRGDSHARQGRGSHPSNSNNSDRPPRGPRPSHFHPSHSSPHDSVPPHRSILIGVPVSIVLKQDQPTGRQVQGIVQDVLTRGDHPRGVKVRLRDGRVGRVQRLCEMEVGLRGEESVGGREAGLGRNGEGGGGRGGEREGEGDFGMRGGGRGGRGGRGFRHVEDIRSSDNYYDAPPDRGTSLGVYFAGLEELDRQHALDRGLNEEVERNVPELQSATAVCPVCGEFEGDEVAVSRHVEGHFGG
ncbi:hypothetical protein GQ43DRAFT_445893 [Delitschia confertaspora ATCC 74209]|uniref:UBZ4-type domain-containing protein n=1 Tax=Delitschia confertaspora ATCC 74209 TaxID=1513339 RepID=A0A9P4JYN7_9PLEO|nr:hypothetical protein GQ43DRAFT_445893 [Delitschia confertaspora ATCC 74209]